MTDIVNRDSTNHTAQVSRPGCGSGFLLVFVSAKRLNKIR